MTSATTLKRTPSFTWTGRLPAQFQNSLFNFRIPQTYAILRRRTFMLKWRQIRNWAFLRWDDQCNRSKHAEHHQKLYSHHKIIKNIRDYILLQTQLVKTYGFMILLKTAFSLKPFAHFHLRTFCFDNHSYAKYSFLNCDKVNSVPVASRLLILLLTTCNIASHICSSKLLFI